MYNTQKVLIPLFFIFLLSLSLPQSLKAQGETRDKLINALTDTSIKVIGKLQEANGGKFKYDFHDAYRDDSSAKQLQAEGYHGGGPSWLGIIYGAFKICDSDLIDTIEMEIEVTGVRFWSTNKEDLDQIGRIVSVIKSDEAILKECVNKAVLLDVMQ